MNSKSLVNCFVRNHQFEKCARKEQIISGCPQECYHRFMYIAPSIGRSLLNINVPFKLILRMFEVVFGCLK